MAPDSILSESFTTESGLRRYERQATEKTRKAEKVKPSLEKVSKVS